RLPRRRSGFRCATGRTPYSPRRPREGWRATADRARAGPRTSTATRNSRFVLYPPARVASAYKVFTKGRARRAGLPRRGIPCRVGRGAAILTAPRFLPTPQFGHGGNHVSPMGPLLFGHTRLRTV